jgi:hypothetical protein
VCKRPNRQRATSQRRTSGEKTESRRSKESGHKEKHYLLEGRGVKAPGNNHPRNRTEQDLCQYPETMTYASMRINGSFAAMMTGGKMITRKAEI